jgi:heme-degrading monooxygenase HmoA
VVLGAIVAAIGRPPCWPFHSKTGGATHSLPFFHGLLGALRSFAHARLQEFPDANRSQTAFNHPGRTAMVIRITWGKLRAGAWNDFERTYRENVLTKGKGLKGLKGRWLAQDAGDKDTGFAVSLWDNQADMQAYEQSPLYRDIMAPLQPFFVGEYKTYRCDVKYSDLK